MQIKDGEKIKINGITRVVYICDQKAKCKNSTLCGNECKLTCDIKHAKNFKLNNGVYEEIRPVDKKERRK